MSKNITPNGKPRTSISTKVLLMALAPMGVLILAYFFFLRPAIGKAILDSKKDGVRQVVESAISVLATEDAKVKAGGMTKEEAQSRAKEVLQGLRYDGNNYVWIQAPGALIVMHPTKPEWNGTVQGTYKDASGQALFPALERAAGSAQGGFLGYTFAKPGQEGTFPKVGFVKNYESWGWIVGSGVYVDDVDRTIRAFNWTALGVMLGICIILSMLVSYLVKRMVRPLDDLVHDLRNSDLSRQIKVVSEDEIGEAAKAFNQYNAELRNKIEELSGYAQRVASGSNELSASAEEMSHAVQEIARVSEGLKDSGSEVSSAMQELSGNADRVARHTQESQRETKVAVSDTARSSDAGTQAVQGMGHIQTATDQIFQAVKVIQEIARQTNLLSLNAAIEAAKAGAQGKGFAVVAEEVRKLAERSRGAAKEIEELIQRTQGAVSEGVDSVKITMESLDAIRRRIEGLSERISQIGVFADGQAETSIKVTEMMSHTSQQLIQNATATTELAATVREIAHTSEDLAQVADGLRNLVGTFKL
jgi:methyl-accepting chemotaxis protein